MSWLDKPYVAGIDTECKAGRIIYSDSELEASYGESDKYCVIPNRAGGRHGFSNKNTRQLSTVPSTILSILSHQLEHVRAAFLGTGCLKQPLDGLALGPNIRATAFGLNPGNPTLWLRDVFEHHFSKRDPRRKKMKTTNPMYDEMALTVFGEDPINPNRLLAAQRAGTFEFFSNTNTETRERLLQYIGDIEETLFRCAPFHFMHDAADAVSKIIERDSVSTIPPQFLENLSTNGCLVLRNKYVRNDTEALKHGVYVCNIKHRYSLYLGPESPLIEVLDISSTTRHRVFASEEELEGILQQYYFDHFYNP